MRVIDNLALTPLRDIIFSFFFSSRRRHTRLQGDWSSDVCSSDLETAFSLMRPPGHHATKTQAMGFCYLSNIAIAALEARATGVQRVAIYDFDVHRSEERRVGKECRSRWSPYH